MKYFSFRKTRAMCDKQRPFVVMYSTFSSCQILMNSNFFERFFEKYSHINFHEIVPSGNGFVPCGKKDRRMGGQTDDGRTDKKKLIVALRNFAQAPKKLFYQIFIYSNIFWCLYGQELLIINNYTLHQQNLRVSIPTTILN
jgi:hypothetical protein